VAKRLPIDLELVQIAFEDHDGDGQWFLDSETGEVLRLNESDDDDLATQIDEGGERYIVIPYQGSVAGHRDMAEFIESVNDNRMRALLDVAINGKGAFRRFKDVLQQHPQERERWFAFQKERAFHRILSWLESEDIEPVTPQPSAN
jgi:hypothetical protein